MNYLRQFRPLNLSIMLIMMLSIHYFLMKPIFGSFQLVFVLDDLHQFLLALSCLLVAAAGYLINNYYDYETDLQNKPQRVLANKNWLLNAYFPVAFAGIVLSVYVAFRAGLMNLAIIQIIWTFLLWKYAESWKGIALFGNVIVSSLLGMLVLMPALYEFIGMSVLRSVETEAFNYLSLTLLTYALFSFWSNLCREIAKTLEDEAGDAATGWQTFTVRFGAAKARNFLWLLFAIAFVGLVFIVSYQNRTSDWKPMVYTLIAVVFPFLVCVWQLYRSKKTQNYSRLSRWLKIWMLGGISTLAAFYYFFYTS